MSKSAARIVGCPPRIKAEPCCKGIFAACGSLALLVGCSPADTASHDASGATQVIVTGASDSNPVVIELYQSQSCSSCPPANANLNRIAGEEGILALSFAVTYWDRLGWTDTFADPAFTQRQWDYAHASDRSSVFTPQVIINGGDPIIGHELDELRATIAERGPLVGGPPIDLEDKVLVVGAKQGLGSATIWLVRYDPASRDVAIGSGENSGRTLPHRNIVRQLVQLGPWNGFETRVMLPDSPEPGLKTAILLQRGEGGPIIAARKL